MKVPILVSLKRTLCAQIRERMETKGERSEADEGREELKRRGCSSKTLCLPRILSSSLFSPHLVADREVEFLSPNSGREGENERTDLLFFPLLSFTLFR